MDNAASIQQASRACALLQVTVCRSLPATLRYARRFALVAPRPTIAAVVAMTAQQRCRVSG